MIGVDLAQKKAEYLDIKFEYIGTGFDNIAKAQYSSAVSVRNIQFSLILKVVHIQTVCFYPGLTRMFKSWKRQIKPTCSS